MDVVVPSGMQEASPPRPLTGISFHSLCAALYSICILGTSVVAELSFVLVGEIFSVPGAEGAVGAYVNPEVGVFMLTTMYAHWLLRTAS